MPSEMERMATSYFKEIFTHGPYLNHAAVLQVLQPKVATTMNDELCKEFSEEEIADALFKLAP